MTCSAHEQPEYLHSCVSEAADRYVARAGLATGVNSRETQRMRAVNQPE